MFSLSQTSVTFCVFRLEGDVSHSPGKPDMAVQNTRRAPKDNVLQRQGAQTFVDAVVGFSNKLDLTFGEDDITN